MAPGGREIPTVEPIERLEDVRDEWERLEALAGHPFATWEWNRTWWERFGAGRSLYSFLCRDADGSVVAILPLYMAARRPVGVARFLGYADLQSPVCAPEHRGIAARALDLVLRRPHRCRVLLAENLPGEQAWAPLLGGRLLGTGQDPVLTFAGRSWDDVMATKRRKFRGNIRRAEAKLVEGRGLTYRLATDPARLPADMDALFHLHAGRWNDASTGVFEGERGAFHRTFADRALRRGMLRLWLAEIDGRAVAAWYGWRFAGADWHYQSGRDTELDALSVGTVLLVHALREACGDGMAAYRFLAGGEDYKWHFAEEDLGTQTRLLSAGAAGRAATISFSVARSVPGPVGRRLMRIAG